MTEHARNTLISFLMILPSVLLTLFLKGNSVPVQYAYFVACTIVLLAVFDFATVVFIEQFRKNLGKLTLPALLAALGMIFAFMIMEALNRFIEHLGYVLLTPFVFLAVLLIYVAIFMEKNLMLKTYLSINSIALLILWVMGTLDKVTMPF